MFIPEYRKIILKNGETAVPETSNHHLVSNFVRLLEQRGLTCFCAFLDRNKARENAQFIVNEQKQQLESGMVPDSEEFIIEDNQLESPGLVDWTGDFIHEDMMEVVMSYLVQMTKRSRLKFISMLSTMVMNDVIYAEPMFSDDDEFEEMSDVSDSEIDEILEAEGGDMGDVDEDEDEDEDEEDEEDWKK